MRTWIPYIHKSCLWAAGAIPTFMTSAIHANKNTSECAASASIAIRDWGGTLGNNREGNEDTVHQPKRLFLCERRELGLS